MRRGTRVLGSVSTREVQTVLSREGLEALLVALRADGRQLVGPTLRDGAIVYESIESVRDLPEGFTDVQDAGFYRLERRHDAALFGYAVGPHSWKKLFLAPTVQLFRARRRDGTFEVLAHGRSATKLALIGARSCDLHAIAIQDKVLRDGAHADADYASRRSDVFVVAVQCGTAGGTCFCASMDTGPRAHAGFDLALTEIVDGEGHRFVVEVGTEAGAAVLERVPHAVAREVDTARADAIVAATARSMGRALDTHGIRDLLMRNLEHPRWDDVASRCLSCTSCTMVCPTCFCTSVEDTTDLEGEHADRTRVWDSCFTLDHSYLHGGSVHASTRSRYRQWLTHKLATWFDQFGSSGCVGCGRCVTWCPVGIDITKEAAAIRATDGAGAPQEET